MIIRIQTFVSKLDYIANIYPRGLCDQFVCGHITAIVYSTWEVSMWYEEFEMVVVMRHIS